MFVQQNAKVITDTPMHITARPGAHNLILMLKPREQTYGYNITTEVLCCADLPVSLID